MIAEIYNLLFLRGALIGVPAYDTVSLVMLTILILSVVVIYYFTAYVILCNMDLATVLRNGTIWPSFLGTAFWAQLFRRQLTIRHIHLGAIRFGARFNKF